MASGKEAETNDWPDERSGAGVLTRRHGGAEFTAWRSVRMSETTGQTCRFLRIWITRTQKAISNNRRNDAGSGTATSARSRPPVVASETGGNGSSDAASSVHGSDAPELSTVYSPFRTSTFPPSSSAYWTCP